MIHVVLAPDTPERQSQALHTLAERAAAYRASPAGVEFAKRRKASKLGWERLNAS
jgi:hypothetical protein